MSRLTHFFKLNCSQIILKNLKESFQNNVSYSSERNTETPPPTNLSRLTSICRDNESHPRQLNPNFIFQPAKLFLSLTRQTIWKQIKWNYKKKLNIFTFLQICTNLISAKSNAPPVTPQQNILRLNCSQTGDPSQIVISEMPCGSPAAAPPGGS